MSVDHYSRRSFDYGALSLDRGQIFQLAGGRNDDKLVRLGYVDEVKTTGARPQCGMCGAKFIDDVSLNIHGNARHKDMTDEERELFLDKRVELEERIAPLNLDQTAAALTGLAPSPAGTGRRR